MRGEQYNWHGCLIRANGTTLSHIVHVIFIAMVYAMLVNPPTVSIHI